MKAGTRHLLGIWLLLVLLLAITVGTAFLDLGAWNAPLNLAIAGLKALLIAASFMHLARAAVVLRIAAVLPIAILAILFALTHGDYASRPRLPAAWQTPAAMGSPPRQPERRQASALDRRNAPPSHMAHGRSARHPKPWRGRWHPVLPTSGLCSCAWRDDARCTRSAGKPYRGRYFLRGNPSDGAHLEAPAGRQPRRGGDTGTSDAWRFKNDGAGDVDDCCGFCTQALA